MSPERGVALGTGGDVLVNMLWCVPGKVGGSEEYLVRQLLGLAEQPGEVVRPIVAAARGLADISAIEVQLHVQDETGLLKPPERLS